jgi:hypothetical protein
VELGGPRQGLDEPRAQSEAGGRHRLVLVGHDLGRPVRQEG